MNEKHKYEDIETKRHTGRDVTGKDFKINLALNYKKKYLAQLFYKISAKSNPWKRHL